MLFAFVAQVGPFTYLYPCTRPSPPNPCVKPRPPGHHLGTPATPHQPPARAGPAALPGRLQISLAHTVQPQYPLGPWGPISPGDHLQLGPPPLQFATRSICSHSALQNTTLAKRNTTLVNIIAPWPCFGFWETHPEPPALVHLLSPCTKAWQGNSQGPALPCSRHGSDQLSTLTPNMDWGGELVQKRQCLGWVFDHPFLFLQ